MKPLLAHVYEPHRVPADALLHVQPKLNGVRALAGTDNQGRWRFQSRDEIPWDYEILEHLSKDLATLGFPKDWVLDGELYVHGWPLQRILGAITPVRKDVRDDTHLVEYHIFDRVEFNRPFVHRIQSVMGVLGSYAYETKVHVVPTQRVRLAYERSPEQLYSSFVTLGYEGMMYRLGDCPYTHPKQLKTLGGPSEIGGARSLKYLSDKDNRVWHMLKRKDWQDGEFICTGVEEGEGKRQGMVGRFNCGFYSHSVAIGSDEVHVLDGNKLLANKSFSVGSFLGFTDADLTSLLINPPIGKKLKIKYLTLSEDGIPLNPTLLAIL